MNTKSSARFLNLIFLPNRMFLIRFLIWNLYFDSYGQKKRRQRGQSGACRASEKISISVNSEAVGWDSWVSTALKSIFWGTLFLNQLHDFSLLSWNSFLHSFWKSKFIKKYSLTPKWFYFRRPIFINHYTSAIALVFNRKQGFFKSWDFYPGDSWFFKIWGFLSRELRIF